MAFESFYGGRRGASFIITKRFDGIDIPPESVPTKSEYAIAETATTYALALTTNSEIGNVKIANTNYYLIKKTKALTDKKIYIWGTFENNGEPFNGVILESKEEIPNLFMPLEYAKGMVQFFGEGALTQSEVNYGDYVIIDTIAGFGDSTDSDNGKVFRRGLNINNGLNGAEYIGQIVGPKGAKGDPGGIRILKHLEANEKEDFLNAESPNPPETLIVDGGEEGPVIATYAQGWCVAIDNEDGTAEIYCYDYEQSRWEPIGRIDASLIEPKYIIFKSVPSAIKKPKEEDNEMLRPGGFWLASERGVHVTGDVNANFSDEIVKYIRKKTEEGFNEPITYLGAEQRFVNALRNSNVNNLEEQYIIGTDTVTETYTDLLTGHKKTIKKFYADNATSNYYQLETEDYGEDGKYNNDFYFSENGLVLAETNRSKASFSDTASALIGQDTTTYIFPTIDDNVLNIYPTTFVTTKVDELYFMRDEDSDNKIKVLKKTTEKRTEESGTKEVVKESIINYL